MRPLKTILVVDDERGLAEALALVLEEQGYRVAWAMNGQEGLTRASELLPDLLIVDLMMPIMNGAQFLLRLRSDERFHASHIILCTSLSETTARNHTVGFDSFLQKPCAVADVAARALSLLGQAPPSGLQAGGNDGALIG